MSKSLEETGFVAAQRKMLTAANNGIIFKLNRKEAESYLKFLDHRKAELVARRGYVQRFAMSIGGEAVWESMGDVEAVGRMVDYLRKVADGGDPGVYDPSDAGALMEFVVEMGRVDNLLLEMQRVEV